MPHTAVRIPQIGEGLQEARLVALLKQPGDRVRRDEPIYQMETDKAVMDVESPVDGVLVRWLAGPDELLAIGAEVAIFDTDSAAPEAIEPEAVLATEEAAPTPAATAGARNAAIPPRTRAYAKEKGLSDDEIGRVPAAGARLMPGDVDAYLAARVAALDYEERPLAPAQRLLAARLVRGSQLTVPGTISVVCDWTAVEARRAADAGKEFRPSAFTMLAYAVARTLPDFPAFRSSLVGDATLRTFHHGTLGIAVSRPGDELVTAAVAEADALDWPTFAARMREAIELARGGRDQATDRVTLLLTNMQSFGLRDAVPVVVPPAVGTLFLGEVYPALDPASETPRLRRVANLALTFDHRTINGVGAAEFLNAVKAKVEGIE